MIGYDTMGMIRLIYKEIIKRKYFFLLFFLMMFIIVPISFGANIHGKIYDFNLEKLDDVIVEVNSSPMQRMLSIEGGYGFELSSGMYKIKASYFDGVNSYSAVEDVEISDDGDFVIDLFLFPELGDDELLDELDGFGDTGLEELQMQYGQQKKNKINLVTLGLVLLLIILTVVCGVIIFLGFQKRKTDYVRYEVKADIKDDTNEKNTVNTGYADNNDINDEDEYDPEFLIKLLKDNDGRPTQKQIRKNIPLSESKVSLMIAELEHKQLIEKIKKGRTNIIILKK